MIGKYKVAAFCTANVQGDDVARKVSAIAKRFEENGWRIMLFASSIDLENTNKFDLGEASSFIALDYGYIDAVIIYQYTIKDQYVINKIISDAKEHNAPVLVIDESDEVENVYNVKFEEGEALKEVVEHLVTEHNVKKYGCVAGFENNEISDKRVEIIKSTFLKHGIEFNERFFGYGNFYRVPTLEVMKHFLEYKDDESFPDAIVCINDSMAITVSECLVRAGFRVPEDVIVTGFDGIEIGRYNIPSMSTCGIRESDLAEALLDILKECEEQFGFDNTSGSTKKITYDTKVKKVGYGFIPEGSCGCKKTLINDANQSINSAYEKIFATDYYGRRMMEMLAKMSKITDLDELDTMLKEFIDYAETKVYVCTNQRIEDGELVYCTFNHSPFTKEVLVKKYFCNEDYKLLGMFEQSKLIPNIEEFYEDGCCPVVYSIHNYEQVLAYMVVKMPVSNEKEFISMCDIFKQLTVNLDTGFELYIQQEKLRFANIKLKSVQENIIEGFADIVESRDDVTGKHIKRTGMYIRLLVNALSDTEDFKEQLPKDICDLMCKAAPLHDIGKIKISDIILNKPGKLDSNEFDVIKTHTTEGSNLIQHTLIGIEDHEYLKMANDMALYHHEKWNGAGYPMGLSGDEIPLSARIMAVVDVFDALSSDRVYKKAFSMDKTFDIIKESSGTHFDPRIVEAFLSIRSEIEKLKNDI